MRFEELEATLGWKKIQDIKLDQALDLEKNNISNTHVEILEKDENVKKARQKNQLEVLMQKKKRDAKTIFLSATPAEYELDLSDEIIQQIIRPTGLLDPITYIYPKS
jgi:helix-turn-helix protein